MGICWYCHWGWPKQIVEIYFMAIDKLRGHSDPLHFGPSHIVWEDENFECAEWCLEHFKTEGNYSEAELEVVRWSLEELIKLPKEIREAMPEDYDEQDPGLYPPPEGVEMVSKKDISGYRVKQYKEL